MTTETTFRDLGVHDALCDALEAKAIVHPFPIQELTLPHALAGNDLIGQARTGTGKTLAFGLPLLQRLDRSSPGTKALVIVPTRELCVQVHADLTIGEALGITSISVYGGVGYDEQTEALTSGAHVVVGTPGRLLDQLDRGNLDLSGITQLVLDEADEMLDMGFLPDVERLIEACPTEGRHTMLFSATMPTEIVRLGRRYMNQPTFTRAEQRDVDTAPTVRQHFFQVHRMDKPRVLARILQSPERGGVFVFVRTKHMADRLVRELDELGTKAIAIHGDLRQTTRESNLARFRSGKADVLVATEVAARGLDVDGVTHVVNYDCPDDDKMYLHRIGRTARAGQAGVAVTFAEFNEADRLNVIRKAVGADEPTVEVFSTSDELTKRFDLPETTPWAALAKGGSARTTTKRPGGNGRTNDARRRAEREAPASQPRQRATNARRTKKPASSSTSASSSREDATTTPRREDATTTPRREDATTTPRREDATTTPRREDATTTPRREDATTTPRTRTRTRTSSSTQSAGNDAAARSGNDTQSSTSRSRTGRTRDGEPSTPSGDTGGSPQKQAGRTRQRAGKPAESTADGGRPREQRGNGSNRNSGKQGSDSTSRGESKRGDSKRGEAGGDKKRNRGNKRGGGNNRGGRGGNARGGGDARTAQRTTDDQAPRVDYADAGESARGTGRPQAARRVKVDHLP